MTQFQMPKKEEKAQFVQDNFNKIASTYDLFNDFNSFFLHRHWKNQIISTIRKAKPNAEVCLDLCCGTGDIALRLSRIPSLIKLYALDFSENMLAVAKERLKNSSISTVEWGDATNLHQIPSDSIDVLTIGFGLRNVSDLEKTLQEIHRVLKPGGIYINLDVGKVSPAWIQIFADFWFFRIVPKIGYILCGAKNDMFDYLPVSSLHYPRQSELKSILEKKGFCNISFRNFVFGNVALHIAYKQ